VPQHKTALPSSTLSKQPTIHPTAFIAKGAVVVGDVHLEEESSVWYTAVLRGDINQIKIGKRSNIQDGCVIHLENDSPCIVGDDVTVGHRAILHGCTVEDAALIGMGAIVLNGAIIKKGAIVAAGAVVKEGMIVPENTLVAGVPAKIIKQVANSTDINIKWAYKYTQLSVLHGKITC